MKIRVLGCSGAIAAGCKTTAFLLDDDVLVDAGSGVGDLTLDELFRIEHILLSHSHLDHILSVPLLADSVIRHREELHRPPIQVHALPQTIEALRAHVFNGIIWPDFSRLPSAEQPVLRFVPFAQGDVLDLNGRRVEVLTAAHTVPAVGFAFEVPPPAAGAASRWFVYTGDTGPNPALWQRLRGMDIAHLVIETAFSDEESGLAKISKHLCPAMLGRELAQLAGSVEVHITHIKPGEDEAVMSEIAALGSPHRVSELAAGPVLVAG
ncbi:MAG: MBL fold metallo-hydrolase [Betaproteobacteria bacterium]